MHANGGDLPGKDRELLVHLYQKEQTRLLRLAASILGPGPRAEDAVHDGFLKLLRCLDQFRDKPADQLAAWLMVVVKNNALDILRKERRETVLAEDWEAVAPADAGEFHALVAIIRGMPEDYRRVLELRFVAEWSLADIAEELHLSESAVKTRIFRGRRLLIRALKKEGYSDGQSCV